MTNQKKRVVDLYHLEHGKYEPLTLEPFLADILISVLKEFSPAMAAYSRHIRGEGFGNEEDLFRGSAEYRLYHHLTTNGYTLKRDTMIQTALLIVNSCIIHNSQFAQDYGADLRGLSMKLHAHYLQHSTNLFEKDSITVDEQYPKLSTQRQLDRGWSPEEIVERQVKKEQEDQMLRDQGFDPKDVRATERKTRELRDAGIDPVHPQSEYDSDGFPFEDYENMGWERD